MSGRRRRGGDPGVVARSAERWLARAILLGTAAAAAAASPGAAQIPELARPAWADRVEAVRDGVVRLAYATRPGVCASGRPHDGGCPCEPVVVARLRKAEGHAVSLDLRGPWAEEARAGGKVSPEESLLDLGEVPPAEAAAFFLELSRTAGERAGAAAVAAATMADGVETWPELLDMARDESLPSGIRRAAVFWVGQAAADRATEGLVGLLEDEVELELREHAVFALSQRKDAASLDALLRIARESPEPRLRKRALFWLSQRPEPRVMALFEEILTGG